MFSKYITAFTLLMTVFTFTASSNETTENKINIENSNDFNTYFITEEMELPKENNAIVAVGIGGHYIKAGSSVGVYLSGITPISSTNFGVYGRGELIRDKYKTGHFWSWKMDLGAGYYINERAITFISVGKCFSNYSTCYFNLRHPTANDDDIDAIYYGVGGYFKDPFFNNTFEISIDWSPYKNYNGSSLYFGYGFVFK